MKAHTCAGGNKESKVGNNTTLERQVWGVDVQRRQAFLRDVLRLNLESIHPQEQVACEHVMLERKVTGYGSHPKVASHVLHFELVFGGMSASQQCGTLFGPFRQNIGRSSQCFDRW